MIPIELGDKVADKVTGFQGIVIGRSTFLNGCNRLLVQSDKLKDGQPVEGTWLDEPQLIIIKRGVVKCGPRNAGGPMPSIPTRNI